MLVGSGLTTTGPKVSTASITVTKNAAIGVVIGTSAVFYDGSNAHARDPLLTASGKTVHVIGTHGVTNQAMTGYGCGGAMVKAWYIEEPKAGETYTVTFQGSGTTVNRVTGITYFGLNE